MSYWRKCLSTGDYQYITTGEPAPEDIVVPWWAVELARKDKRIAELYAELREEARLNNMGAEREAQLLTRIDELERDMKRFDWFKSAKCKAELECAKKAKRIAELEADKEQLVDAAKAKDDMLVCYRLGKQPSEKLFARLEKANLTIAKHRGDA